MINVNDLIQFLYKSGKLGALVSTFFRNSIDWEHEEDFIQDLVIILLEYKDKERLLRMYARNELDFFILGIIRNSLLSDRSEYYRKYIQYEKRKVANIEECDADTINTII